MRSACNGERGREEVHRGELSLLDAELSREGRSQPDQSPDHRAGSSTGGDPAEDGSWWGFFL